MLAEIAAANAAFKVIKAALNNGKELYDCSEAAQSYFSNKSIIAKRVSQKGKSDLEAFMALEKIKEQEEWLREYMIYAGRPDMYSDFLKFQADCKRERELKARQALAKRRLNLHLLKQFITFAGLAIALVPVLAYVVVLLLKK